MNDEIDEYGGILPLRSAYKYMHLEQYEEHELIQAFCVELILRYIDCHNMMIQETVFEQVEDETDEEFEKRMNLEELRLSEELDERLIKHFGLDTSEIASIFLTHPYSTEYSDDIKIQFRFPSKSNILNVDIDLSLSEEELISMILQHKKKFDENEEVLDLLNLINELYSQEIKNAFKDFPNRLIEKKRAMIDALYTFDYIQMRDKEIGKLNQEAREDYEAEKEEIISKSIDEYNKKQELEDLEIKYNKDTKISRPSKNTSSKNSYFKEERFKQSKIAPGRAKKIFYIIEELITETIK
ncbi:MAG: hypothetical protein KJ899_15280 [Gammaproteobacteria bacterium]|nr:hypothetical protein [Gammaproteobacteria bacterium]